MGMKRPSALAQAGARLARLAVSSDMTGVTSKVYDEIAPVSSSEESYDKAKQIDLWQWTVDHLARDDSEKQAFELF